MEGFVPAKLLNGLSRLAELIDPSDDTLFGIFHLLNLSQIYSYHLALGICGLSDGYVVIYLFQSFLKLVQLGLYKVKVVSQTLSFEYCKPINP